ncbi:zinc-binding alcohol dehydrogenase [Planctomycetota bacterium]
MQARQLVFPDKGRCEIEAIDINEKLEDEQVLVKNAVSLVSAGTELAMFTRTHRGFDEPDFGYAKYPFRPGYAAVGEVLAVGDGIESVRERDMVVHSGFHATHGVITEDQCAKLPHDITPKRAAFYRLAIVSITAPLLAPAVLGESAVIVGAGIVGNLCAQLYRSAGAGTVAVADLMPRRLNKAVENGIDLIFNTEEKPLKEWAEDLGPRGAELVIEAVGIPATIEMSLKAVAPKGRVVLLGSPRVNMEVDPYFDIHVKGVQLIGAHGHCVSSEDRQRTEPYLLNMLARNQLKVDNLITQEMPFENALEAFEGLRDKKDEYLGVILTYT